MGVYWIPISISEQLEVVQLLQKVPFIPHDQIDFLSGIEKTLKRNIRLTENQKQKLDEILVRFGYRI